MSPNAIIIVTKPFTTLQNSEIISLQNRLVLLSDIIEAQSATINYLKAKMAAMEQRLREQEERHGREMAAMEERRGREMAAIGERIRGKVITGSPVEEFSGGLYIWIFYFKIIIAFYGTYIYVSHYSNFMT